MSEVEREASLYQHVEELLVRARRALIAVIAAMAAVSIAPARLNPGYETIVTYLLHKVESDLLPSEVQLIAGKWTDVIIVYFYMALLLGLLIASPIVAYEIYMYVKPALYPRERRELTWFVASFTALFALGVLFSYTTLLPWTYKFLVRFAWMVGASALFTVEDFLGFTLLVMLAVGLTFTFPTVTTLLVRLDVMDPEALTRRWREVVVAVFVVAAVITPDVSGFTMLMLAAPILALYAIAVVVARAVYRRRGGPRGVGESRRRLAGGPSPQPHP